MMKRFLILILLGFRLGVLAQTAVEKKTVDGTSTVLDFASGTTKGIILPAVETLPVSPANGTFLLDKTDKKIKMFQNNVWVELSGAGDIAGMVPIAPYSGTVDNGKQTVIGARSTSADGVLVLESANKAMILPKISNPHLNVKSPYPGMMCYDTNRKALAVFDGKVWNYWK
ncbi:MAG: hypothetical protein P0Y49_15895 [Candidatus Pedobacter colombiensis]|uniref:WG repeat-containing protein n=1 Tax=Candidatus Pedobacter colombiensis TaxID=3121371 RepID=A0AAJ6B5Y4_9SPHI|nr:hypothetical protein [Pedobacter sp.]WEK18274.1 MAG: hypothetical protein P0Y49_15895 [Pedobacter sp.]